MDILVGNQRKKYVLHKDMLCHSSAYFAAALNSNFEEAVKQTVVLPEADPTTFSMFSHWVYSRDFARLQKYLSIRAYGCCILWVFADAHGVPQLQNQIIEHWCGLAQLWDLEPWAEEHLKILRCDIVDPLLIEYAYNNTVPGSKLRRFICDLVRTVDYARKGSFESAYGGQRPAEFMREMLNLVMERGLNFNRMSMVPENYYVTDSTLESRRLMTMSSATRALLADQQNTKKSQGT